MNLDTKTCEAIKILKEGGFLEPLLVDLKNTFEAVTFRSFVSFNIRLKLSPISRSGSLLPNTLTNSRSTVCSLVENRSTTTQSFNTRISFNFGPWIHSHNFISNITTDKTWLGNVFCHSIFGDNERVTSNNDPFSSGF